MSDLSTTMEHEAVTRLFELARNGDVDNCEFAQLDSLVYERLRQAYTVNDGVQPHVQTMA